MHKCVSMSHDVIAKKTKKKHTAAPTSNNGELVVVELGSSPTLWCMGQMFTLTFYRGIFVQDIRTFSSCSLHSS